nr:unnamed protein product [Callosobruchus analis]
MEQRSALIQCPLCLNHQFEGVDTLRASLVAAATSPLKCPVCTNMVVGLDKLAIHLLGHLVDEKKVTGKDAVDADITTPTESQQEIDRDIESNIVRVQNIDIAAIPSCSNEDNSQQRNAKELEISRCDICNFCFTDKNILDMHQKLLHQTNPDKKGFYNYHCHLCSKKFKMRGSLMIHLRVAHYGFWSINANHNGNIDGTTDAIIKRQYDKNEIVAKNQNTHIKYNVPNNKQWECDVCTKKFTTKYFLKKHKRLHTGKRFRQRVSYLVHRRIHTGAMPYQCALCDKRFRYKVSQRSHKCCANPLDSCVGISKDIEEEDIQRQSIVLNNKEQIEISFNKIDFQLAMEATKLSRPKKSATVIEEIEEHCFSQSKLSYRKCFTKPILHISYINFLNIEMFPDLINCCM